MGRIAILEEPKSIDEARTRMIDVNLEIEKINTDMGRRFRYRDEDGMPMTPEEHLEWKKRAIAARNWFFKERAIVEAWIEQYEQDVRAEEEAERQREKEAQRKAELAAIAERQRLKREAAREASMRYAQNEASTREWKERMIREFGTTKVPPHIYQQQQLELERLRAEHRAHIQVTQANSERARRRKQAHKEWLKQLEIDDPVNGLSLENLLARAYRLLQTLAKEDRGPTYAERTILDVISQRNLILADYEETTP